MSSIFNAATVAVPVKAAAERYGLHPDHAGMVRCPFHDDHTPSLRLNDRYYYCFGCGATGDVVDLTAQLFGLQSYEAACKLAKDFDLNIEKPAGNYVGRPDTHSHVNRCQQVLEDYLDLLVRWKNRYSPAYEADTPDWRYAEACQMLDYIEYMALVLSSGTPEQRSLLAEKLTADGKMDQLEERLKRQIREEAPV